MSDREKIFERFAECYGITKSAEFLTLFGVKSSTVSQWKTGKRPVPRDRLKKAVDDFQLSWDWILDGKSPKKRQKRYWDHCEPLNDQEITKRFLDLFQGMTQTEIAAMLDISSVAVHYMYENKMKVPWDKIEIAVEKFGTTWEWVLEGRRHGSPKGSG